MNTLQRPQRAVPTEDDLKLDSEAWQRAVTRYAKPTVGRTLFSLATSIVPFLLGWAAMFFLMDVSYLLVLALAVPTAGFLVRTFILFHDATHGSLLRSRRVNDWVGSVLALMVFTPFARWRSEHIGHHATAGNLDRRGIGDVPTLTLAEYTAKKWPGRLGYRLFRNPAVMFGLGPLWGMLIQPRYTPNGATDEVRHSVWRTNIALGILVATLCWLFGWQDFLLVEAPLVLLAGGSGIWLFYVQHQFEDVYWERTADWSYPDAALRGSSYLRLPKLFQFFTGSIGLHHVHHLNPQVPNYRLQRVNDEVPVFERVPRLSFWDGVKATRLKLIDERTDRLLTWADVRRLRLKPAVVSTGRRPG